MDYTAANNDHHGYQDFQHRMSQGPDHHAQGPHIRLIARRRSPTVNDVKEIRHDMDITRIGDSTWGIIYRKKGGSEKNCSVRIYEQQLGACIVGWLLTLIESGAAVEGALAASACESIRRALISLNRTAHC